MKCLLHCILGLGLAAQSASGVIIFSDNFESGPADGSDPTGWVVTEPASTTANMDTTPGWSPYNRVVRLNDNGNAADGAAIAKDGLNVGDFVLEFDVHNHTGERNGPFTVKLTDAGGKAIFSGVINYNPAANLDNFDTGLHNANEPDVTRAVPFQDFAGSPPYLGLHVKIEVNHGAGTYDLTLGGTLYAGNALASDVIGANLAKVEFFGGEGGATSTSVWLDNVVLDAVPEPTSLALLGILPLFMRRRTQ